MNRRTTKLSAAIRRQRAGIGTPRPNLEGTPKPRSDTTERRGRTGSGPWAQGSTRAWRKRRAEKLERNPICEMDGCTAEAVEVDHVIQRSQGGGDDLSNLRSLCETHHMKRHGKRRRYPVDPATGISTDPEHWWNKE